MNSLFWVEHKKTQKPIAFARATGDNVFNAIIWDMVVDPLYQGIGLGKAVMERLAQELLEKGIVNIALYSKPEFLAFIDPWERGEHMAHTRRHNTTGEKVLAAENPILICSERTVKRDDSVIDPLQLRANLAIKYYYSPENIQKRTVKSGLNESTPSLDE
ncbi:hypothetical protein GH714_042409 [Hevea brasiliensis]|uniref:N-acetyltransferase domain-containing protein n=1 Tax=Hevea brasiliensis TaxID=3981 RepID=A0A6A6NF96_HEVBR|nr:hypothetical protein GH714_042409 [Hevea brasiliensis]